jgi:beta-glucosidase
LAAAQAPPPAHSAVTPAARGDQGWKDRAKLLDERLQQTPDTQVLFIGDSITQGWEGEGKKVWSKYYASRKAVNLGIGGDRTQHVLWRLDHAPLDNVKPKAAVVMIGTNNSNAEDNTPGQIAEGVRAIVRRIRDRLPQTKILLLAIFPRGENYNSQRGKLCQVNQVLQKLDDGQQVFLLDIGHRFLNDEGLLPADVMPDYLHLTARGYQIWAESIERKMSELLGDRPVRSARVDPSGEWTWKIKDPNEEMIEAPLVLKLTGDRVEGTFHAQGDRKLEIEKGTLKGNELKLTVRRQRTQGGEMVYEVTGLVEGNQITGKVSTEMDGRTVTQDWSAKRKP